MSDEGDADSQRRLIGALLAENFLRHIYPVGEITTNEERMALMTIAQSDLGIRSELTENLLIAIQQENIRLGDVSATIHDVAVRVLANRRCDCLSNVRMEYIEVLLHIWQNLGGSFGCQDILLVNQFALYEHGRLPNHTELEQFTENMMAVQNDPDEYCNLQKHNIPTPGIGDLQATVAICDSNCSICSCDIVTGSKIITLLPCQHQFHAESIDCLGEGSIVTWLEKSRWCPVCRGEVLITGQ